MQTYINNYYARIMHKIRFCSSFRTLTELQIKKLSTMIKTNQNILFVMLYSCNVVLCSCCLVLFRVALYCTRVVSCCTRIFWCCVVLYSYLLSLVLSGCIVLCPVVTRVAFWTRSLLFLDYCLSPGDKYNRKQKTAVRATKNIRLTRNFC